ncbi:hypothetical protein [Capsulimonas corticalis]|uniref:hypothetical protein n=1 Tax=Capsulimonas corticalis TaxID=2219043 RepID=UPI000F650B24|nr:hypothetical protein [Capsulimonas corticalis]
MLKFNRHFPVLCTLLGVASVNSAHAALVVIGAPYLGNYAPFGTSGGAQSHYAAGCEYQQIYPHNTFYSVSYKPVIINQISFASERADFAGNQPKINVATYHVTLSFSNTSSSLSAPSTIFDENKGSNFTQVFSGDLSTTLKGDGSFDLNFPTSPFLYDPSKGNLLFDVFINADTDSTGDAGFDFTTGAFSRVAKVGGDPNLDTYAHPDGLVTQFRVIPATVPEPTAPVSFAIGVLGLSAMLCVSRKRCAANSL